MSSADLSLQRATVYLEDARDASQHPSTRFEALDASRAALLDARRFKALPQSVLPIYTGLLTTAAADPSYSVRIVVPQVIEDFCMRDLKSFVPPATHFLMRSLHDEHLLVAKRAVRALTSLFRRLIGFVVHVGVGDGFPEARLTVWLQMQAKAMSFIQATDEGLRKAATKFAETVVLAFSYSGGGASPEHFTLEYVVKRGSASALLNVDKLEQEGILCVKAVTQLVHDALDGVLVTKKPDESPPVHGLPPATFMTAIFVLSNFVRRRPRLIQFTLPPLLTIVAAITGTLTRPSRAFHSLTPGQQASVLIMLKLSLQVLRGYSHTRADNWNNDITRALSDLSTFEESQEVMRKERATLAATAQKRLRTKMESVLPTASSNVEQPIQAYLRDRPDISPSPLSPTLTSPTAQMLTSSSQMDLEKRSQPLSLQVIPGPRLPANKAFAATQALLRTMRPQEVVNFIITRLLLNIPSETSVPGAAEAARQAKKRSLAPLEDSASISQPPSLKKPKRSRFGTKDGTESAVQPAPVVKKITVRKAMPPVVPAKLSAEATDRLIALCCRRILKRDAEAKASGAGPLRLQILARILAQFVHEKKPLYAEFCNEACIYIVEHLDQSIPLALGWLHCLAVRDGFIRFTKIDGKNCNSNHNPEIGKNLGTVKPNNISPGNKNVKEENIIATNSVSDDKHAVDERKGQTASHAEDNNGMLNGDVGVDEFPKQAIEGSKVTENTNAIPVGGVIQKPSSNDDNQAYEKANVTMTEIEEELLVDDEDDEECTKGFVKEAYECIFLKLLTLLQRKGDVGAEVFGKVISEVPIVPDIVIKFMGDMCKEPSSIKTGLQTICTVVEERPGKDRGKCLALLFDLTCNEDDAVRGPAIRLVANKMFVEGEEELKRLIEERVIERIEKVVDGLCSDKSSKHVSLLERVSMLMTALCGQKNELVRYLGEAFVKLPREGKDVIKKWALELAGHVRAESKPLVDLVGGALLETHETSETEGKRSDKAEELALSVLQGLTRKQGQVGSSMVEAAMRRYEMCGDIKFMLAVLEGLSRDVVVKHLAKIVEYAGVASQEAGSERTAGKNAKTSTDGVGTKDSTRTDIFKEVIGKLTTADGVGMRAGDILVELHKLRPTAAVSMAIRQCFEQRAIFDQEAIAQAIQQVVDMTVIPDMLMRTVILARSFYPEMEGYLTDTIMKGLIAKKVWTNPVLWDGFMLYCVDVKKSAVKVLLTLPMNQLEDALLKKEELRALFRDVGKANSKSSRKIPTKYRKVIVAALKKASSDK